jgi:anti-anti-sigma factor
MEFTTKHLERATLFTITGRVDHSTAPELRQGLMKAIESGHHNLVVDLSSVSYMGTAGLKVLQAAAKTVRATIPAGDVRLAGMPANVKEAFDLVGFTPLFKLYGNAVEAVGSF